MPHITLANGVKFDCQDGQTILDAAIKNEVSIEHSCKNGRCKICVAPVISGETRLVQDEESLDSSETVSGEILTCCRTAVTDIFLDVEDLGELGSYKPITSPCRVDSLQMLSNDVLEIKLRLPPSTNFNYMAGQYINLIADGGIRRSYSIANDMRDDGKIILHIKHVKNGIMSNFLFNSVKKNDLLRIEGPFGTFSFRDYAAENIVFMATGTGIAPVKAILESLEKKEPTARIIVLWGGRYSSDLYWHPENIQLPIEFIPVLSRESRDGVFRGYVQHVLLSLNLDLRCTSVYACGSEKMIADSQKVLLEQGLPRKSFFSDAFVSSN